MMQPRANLGRGARGRSRGGRVLRDLVCGRTHRLWMVLAVKAPPGVAAVPRPSILGVSPDEMVPLVGGKGRAKLVWEVLRSGGDPMAADSGLGKKARAALEEYLSPISYELSCSTVSSCGTRKLLIDLERGDAVETVIIPQEDQSYSTLCVSSQVGCRQACSFCATGTMGLLRSLGTDEILSQVHAAQAAALETGMPPIRNIVRSRTSHRNPKDAFAFVARVHAAAAASIMLPHLPPPPPPPPLLLRPGR